MASVVRRGEIWYLKFRDHRGAWVRRASTARTKTEARRLADDLERHCERQRLGLERLPDETGGGTLANLMQWWLETYSVRLASHQRNGTTIRAHLLDSELGARRLSEVTPGAIECFLQAKSAALGPQSLNHLRMFILGAFSAATKAGKHSGTNPAKDVERRRIPRRTPAYLRAEEVPRVLEHVPEPWRALFATAIYTGLRRGELPNVPRRRSSSRPTTAACVARIPRSKTCSGER